MQVAATCPECGSGTQLEVGSTEQAEYVGCPDCGHRFLWESAGGDGADAASVVPVTDDELDWGGVEGGDGYVALYPTTNRPQIAGLLLLLAALLMLTTVVLLNGMLGDANRVDGITTKANQMMEQTGMQSEEQIDEEFVRSVLRAGIIWELFCTVLATAGGVLVLLRQNYTLVLVGCAAAIVGLGQFMLATLFGAIALYLVLQSRSEFGIIEEESW
jgi:DNA-directed RNA polymerase subunit RPC12/RpoP